jgi:CheY-like chemotaxis protein/LmbE family N-acetylglucosaminyl deacetylase
MSEGNESPARVLLVDDSLTDATLIRTVMERDGDLRVTAAQDGIRGCQLVEGRRWDLVVTDLNLPGRDGVEVIVACRTHQPDTPIIAISAFVDPTYRERARQAGASEVLLKPVDPVNLLRAARKLLDLRTESTRKPKIVLAIGAFTGDVEAGCGGGLMKYGLGGDAIHILVLALGSRESDPENQILTARKAANVLGAHLHVPAEELVEVPDPDTISRRIKEMVNTLEPEVVFAPSAKDVRESRRQVQTATEMATRGVKSFLCYQAATTTLEFRPNLFEDISGFLDQKMAALSHYSNQVPNRPHLDIELARATARYWGRFMGYGEVEPFEVIRHTL